MREIKFRGRALSVNPFMEQMTSKAGEFVFGNLIIADDGVCLIQTWNRTQGVGYTHNVSAVVDPKTVGQYIETINGHEIYHHDIVKAYKYGDTDTDPFIRKITYRNGTWWFGNWTWIEFLQIFRCVEVIGNIYDNPELLKEESKC